MGKKHDFIATFIHQPHATLEEWVVNGITPDNTEIKDIEYYKANDTIKQIYTENGEFQEDKFVEFYDSMLRVYNEFADGDYAEKALKLIESSPRDWTNLDAKRYDPSAVIRVMNVPNKAAAGMSTMPTPRFSDAEIAQANFVRDEQGNVLDWTPNDKGGLWKGVFREPMALAIYEEDGFHEENGVQVPHQKGEVKRDENGNAFYEILGSKNAAGRQILKYTDTITKEGVWINDYDFLDSDGFKKSIVGTLAKTAFQIAPYLYGPTRKFVGAVTASKELATALPILINSINTMVGNDDENEFGQKLNKWSNRMQSFKTGMTEHGNEHFMSLESIGNMVASSVNQLYQQRMIGLVPTWFSKNADPNTAKNLSAAYMALTSAQDSYDSFKEAGATDAVAGWGAFASFAAMFGLMKTDYFGGWLTKGTWAEVKDGTKQTSKELGKVLNQRAYENAKGSVKDLSSKEWFNRIYTGIQNTAKSIKDVGWARPGMSVGEQFVNRSLNEAVEETVEEVTFDTIKGIFGAIEQLFNIKLSDEQYERLNFNWTLQDALKRYGASFIGGAIGGAVFEGVNQLEILNNPKLRGFQNSDIRKRILWLYANNHGDELEAEWDKLYDAGKLGNKNLSAYKKKDVKLPGTEKIISVYETGSETDNQNLAVYQAGKLMLQHAKHFLTNNRWKYSNEELAKKLLTIQIEAENRDESIAEYMENADIADPIVETIIEGNFLDFATTHIYDEINAVSKLENDIEVKRSEIIKKYNSDAEIKNALSSDLEIKALEKELKEKKDFINSVLKGEKADYYLELGMFAADDVAQKRIASTEELLLNNVESYVKFKHHLDYNKLSEEDKHFYKKSWEVYKNSIKDVKLKNRFDVFRAVNEHVTKSLAENPIDLSQTQLDPYFNTSVIKDPIDITLVVKEIQELEGMLARLKEEVKENPDKEKIEAIDELQLKIDQKNSHLMFMQDYFTESLTDTGEDFMNNVVKSKHNWNGLFNIQIARAAKITEDLSKLQQSDEDYEEKLKKLTDELDEINESIKKPISNLAELLEQYHNSFIEGDFVKSNTVFDEIIVREVLDMAFISKFGANYDRKNSLLQIKKQFHKYWESALMEKVVDFEGFSELSPYLNSFLGDFLNNIANEPLNIEAHLSQFKTAFSKSYEIEKSNEFIEEDSKKFNIDDEIKKLFTDFLPIYPLIQSLQNIQQNLNKEKRPPIESLVQKLFTEIEGKPSNLITFIGEQIKDWQSNPSGYELNDNVIKHLDDIQTVVTLIVNALDAASNGYNVEANSVRQKLGKSLLAEISDTEAQLYKVELNKWYEKIDILKKLSEFNRETADKYQTDVGINMETIYMKNLVNGPINEQLTKECKINVKQIWDSINTENIQFDNVTKDTYEHFEELVLKFRQALHEQFKQALLSDGANQKEFFKKLVSCFGPDLWQGLNGEFTNDPDYQPTGNQMLSHFLGIVGQDQNQFGSLLKFVSEHDEYKKFVTYSSQIETVRDAMSFIINPDLYNNVADAIYESQNSVDNEYIKNRPSAHNILTILGGPGTGKTSAVGRAIRLMVNELDGEVVATSFTESQVKNLVKNLDGDYAVTSNIKFADLLNGKIQFNLQQDTDYIEYGKDGSTITLKKEFIPKESGIFQNNSKYKVLIVDEFTYANGPEIQALIKSAEKEKYVIIGLADDGQNSKKTSFVDTKGTTHELDSDFQDFVMHTTPYLTVSMRADNKTQYKNVSILGKSIRKVLNDYKKSRHLSASQIQVPIDTKLYYCEHDGDLYGVKNIVEANTSQKASIIKEYIERFQKQSDKTILVITDRIKEYSSYVNDSVNVISEKDAEKLLRIVNKQNAQGLEADYVLIEQSNSNSGFFRLKDFNTLTTRARRAVVYLSNAKPEGFTFELDPDKYGYLSANQLRSDEQKERDKAFFMSPYKMGAYSATNIKKTTNSQTFKTSPIPPPPSVSFDFPTPSPVYKVDENISESEVIKRYENRETNELLHDWYRFNNWRKIMDTQDPILDHGAYIKWLYETSGQNWLKKSEWSPFKDISDEIKTLEQWNEIFEIINCLALFHHHYGNYEGWAQKTKNFIDSQKSKLGNELGEKVGDIITDITESTGAYYYVLDDVVYYVYTPMHKNTYAIPIAKSKNVANGKMALSSEIAFEETLTGLSTEGNVFKNVAQYKQNGVYFSKGRVFASKSGYNLDDGKCFVNASHLPWLRDQDYYHDDADTKGDSEIKKWSTRIGVQDRVSFANAWNLLRCGAMLVRDSYPEDKSDPNADENAKKTIFDKLGISESDFKNIGKDYYSADHDESKMAAREFVSKIKAIDILDTSTVEKIITSLFTFVRKHENVDIKKNFSELIFNFVAEITPIGQSRKGCFNLTIKSNDPNKSARRFVFSYVEHVDGKVKFDIYEIRRDNTTITNSNLKATVEIEHAEISWFNDDFLTKIFNDDKFKEVVSNQVDHNGNTVDSSTKWASQLNTKDLVIENLTNKNITLSFGHTSKSDENSAPRYHSMDWLSFYDTFNAFFKLDHDATSYLSLFEDFLKNDPEFKHTVYTNIKGVDYYKDDSSSYKHITKTQHDRLQMDICSILLPIYRLRKITDSDDSDNNDIESHLKVELTKSDLNSDSPISFGEGVYEDNQIKYTNGHINRAFINKYVKDSNSVPKADTYIIESMTSEKIVINGAEYQVRDGFELNDFLTKSPKIYDKEKQYEFKVNSSNEVVKIGKDGKQHSCKVISVDNLSTMVLDENGELYTIPQKLNVKQFVKGEYCGILTENSELKGYVYYDPIKVNFNIYMPDIEGQSKIELRWYLGGQWYDDKNRPLTDVEFAGSLPSDLPQSANNVLLEEDGTVTNGTLILTGKTAKQLLELDPNLVGDQDSVNISKLNNEYATVKIGESSETVALKKGVVLRHFGLSPTQTGKIINPKTSLEKEIRVLKERDPLFDTWYRKWSKNNQSFSNIDTFIENLNKGLEEQINVWGYLYKFEKNNNTVTCKVDKDKIYSIRKALTEKGIEFESVAQPSFDSIEIQHDGKITKWSVTNNGNGWEFRTVDEAASEAVNEVVDVENIIKRIDELLEDKSIDEQVRSDIKDIKEYLENNELDSNTLETCWPADIDRPDGLTKWVLNNGCSV